MQTKTQSLIESLLNTLSGFVLSVIVSITVFPLFGVHLKVLENVAITLVFTVVSVIRSYFWRRFFNGKVAGHSGCPQPEAKLKPSGKCTMGVGCDEAGVCYANYHGQPEMCGMTEISGIDIDSLGR